MKNTELFQDAIGSIDDDLITDAKKPIKKKNAFYIAWAAAACVAIFIGSIVPLFSGDIGEGGLNYNSGTDINLQESSNVLMNNSSDVGNTSKEESGESLPPDDYSNDAWQENSDQNPNENSDNESSNDNNNITPPDDGDNNNIQNGDNIWEKNNFSVLFIVYGNGAKLRPVNAVNSPSDYLSDTAIKSEKVEINVDSTIKVESVLSDRYIVYFSQIGYPIIYDLKEQKEVDLTDRILGADRVDGEKVYQTVIERAEQEFPGISATQNNRDIIYTLVMSWMNGESYGDEYSFMPDMEYLKDHEIYGQTYEVYMPFYPDSLYYIFFDGVFLAYRDMPSGELTSEPYGTSIIWIDHRSGRCLVRTRDIRGQTKDTLIYDIANDKIIQLKVNNLGNFTDGYEIVFSNDGSRFALIKPVASVQGVGHNTDFNDRYSDVNSRSVQNYFGESYSVVYIDDFQYVEITNEYNKEGDFGRSKAYFSENANVIYYKLLSEKLSNSIKCDADVWYNRLARFDTDEDIWVFCTVENGYAKKTKIQGKFVKFACNETVVIMEKGGINYAYLIEDGSNVTDKVINNEIAVAPNERLLVYYSEGTLYKKDIFTGEIAKLITCDSYILNTDNSFAFTYKNGDSFVTCLNVVTGESRRIIIENELCKQLFADRNSVFMMNYNETENTLTLSFYKSDEIHINEETKDFYYLVGQLEDIKYVYDPESDADVTVYEIEFYVNVDESVVEAFRQYVIDYKTIDWGHDPSVIYPLGLTPEDTYYEAMQKIGITLPETYISMNNTRIVLYSGENETLEFLIGRCMPIYTPNKNEQENNFTIVYTVNGKEYHLM